jgi:chromosome segregation ATPase
MSYRDFRKQSRDICWGTSDEGMTLEQINCGSLLRIADATEKMCQDREKLERDYHYMRGQRDRYREQLASAERRIAALKGVVTRMKKRQQAQKELPGGAR